MFRFAVIVLAFFTFAYSRVVFAQAPALAGYELFMAKVTTFGATTVAYATNGAVLANGVRTFSAPTFSAGGAAVATAARVAVGTGTAAVVVTGGVTGAEVFAAARLLAMGGGGVVGIGLTALTMAPMVADYFSSEKLRLRSKPDLDSSKPFEIYKENCIDVSCESYHASGDSNPATSSSISAAMGQLFVQYKKLYGNDLLYARTGCNNAGSSEPDVYICSYTETRPGGLVGTGNMIVIRTPGGPAGLSWVPASWDDIAPYMDKPISPDVFKALLDAGAKIKVTPRSITGPAEVVEPATTSTTETPEKLTTTTTTGKTKLEYKERVDPATGKTEPYVQATPSSTVVTKEKDKATGVEKIVSTTETQTDEKPKSTEKIETCGLPGKPACIVDETGMPDQAAIDAKMDSQKAKNVYKDIDDMAKDPTTKMPVHPTVNWSFALPTGCAVIPLPAFEPFIQPIDVCQFKPMFHDVMNIVWLFGGIFGAISLFMKNALSH